jgi:hypothetical protein
LFVTVIDIDAKQYAKIEIGGLFVMLEIAAGGATPPLLDPDFEERKESLEDGDDRPFKSPISIA